MRVDRAAALPVWAAGVARRPAIAAVLPAVVAAALYWGGLNGPLLLDDYATLGPLLELRSWPGDWLYYVLSPSGPLRRPVAMLSFLANLRISGAALFYWKLTNLAIHCANGVLLCVLTHRLAGLGGAFSDTGGRRLALAVAAVWLLHPLQVSTVLYTVQRMTELAALFCITGMLVYVDGRERQLHGAHGFGRIAAAFAVCMPLAALSKETGLLLGAYLAVIETTLFGGRGPRAVRRGLAILYAVFLGGPLVAGLVYVGVDHERILVETHRNLGMDLPQRLMTEGRVLVLYLAQILVPAQRNLGFFHDDLRLSSGWFEPPSTAAALLVLVALALSAVWATRRLPLYACGVWLFFAGHALESSIFPLELMFEHRNYLPSYGVLLAGGALVAATVRAARARAAVCAVFVTLLGSVSAARIADWSSADSMYRAFYAANPRSERAASLFADQLAGHGDHRAALRVLGAFTGTSAALHRLYLECQRDGALPPAALAPRLLGSGPVMTSAIITNLAGLARLALAGTCRVDAAAMAALLEAGLARSMTFAARRQVLMVYAAHFRWRAGARDVALALLEQAQPLVPADPVPLFLAAEWLCELGRRGPAERMLARATRVARRSRKDYGPMQRAVGELLRALPP